MSELSIEIGRNHKKKAEAMPIVYCRNISKKYVCIFAPVVQKERETTTAATTVKLKKKTLTGIVYKQQTNVFVWCILHTLDDLRFIYLFFYYGFVYFL